MRLTEAWVAADSLLPVMRRSRTVSVPARLSALVVAVLLLAGCANAGTPKDWAEQADETGKGLAERNFIDACVAADDDLTVSRATSLCECVLAEVQGSASYADFEKLNDHFKNNSDAVTESGLADLFPWFTDAVASCAT